MVFFSLFLEFMRWTFSFYFLSSTRERVEQRNQCKYKKQMRRKVGQRQCIHKVWRKKNVFIHRRAVMGIDGLYVTCASSRSTTLYF